MSSTLNYRAKCCGKCVVIAVVLSYILINYLHYVTCYFHVAFCTPLLSLTDQMENPFDGLDEDEYIRSIHEAWNEHYDTTTAACATSFDNTLASKRKLGILLTDTRLEATQIAKQLKRYNGIQIVSLPDISWYDRIGSDTELFVKRLDEELNKCVATPVFNETETFCFLPMYIGSLPTSQYKTLVDYVYCHEMMVLQIYRQALITSYLLSDDWNEAISVGYVQEKESNRERLEKMIKLHMKYIKHLRFDYEDLTGVYARSFWNALVGWIGEAVSLRITEDVMVDVERDKRAETDLPEWCVADAFVNKIESVLRGTEALYLCKKYNEQSVIRT